MAHQQWEQVRRENMFWLQQWWGKDAYDTLERQVHPINEGGDELHDVTLGM